MKLRNKKTGGIVDLFEIVKLDDLDNEFYLRLSDNEGRTFKVGFNSLTDLNEEWEDYEEPKGAWAIGEFGELYEVSGLALDRIEELKEIGNYFETREEAEKAVEKLKTWKRLEDKGFRFTLTPGVGSLDITPGKFQIEITAEMPEKWFCCDAVQDDLDDCFGGEE